jgi:predicted O-methyltransferase YrrM
MTGVEYISELIRRGEVETCDGVRLPLHSGTSVAQCEFIQKHIRELNATTTLEVGLAFGLSAVAICDEIRSQAHATHHVIDPHQNSPAWAGAGLQNLRRMQLIHLVKFYEEPAECCLPKLNDMGLQIDLAYIDAGKRLDDTLLYSHYILKMLRVGGRAIYDDAAMPGVRQALRYLSQDPRFKVIDRHAPDPKSISRWIAERACAAIPKKRLLFSPEVACPSDALGVGANCVVLERVGGAEADWRWHPPY